MRLPEGATNGATRAVLLWDVRMPGVSVELSKFLRGFHVDPKWVYPSIIKNGVYCNFTALSSEPSHSQFKNIKFKKTFWIPSVCHHFRTWHRNLHGNVISGWSVNPVADLIGPWDSGRLRPRSRPAPQHWLVEMEMVEMVMVGFLVSKSKTGK
jgi:hypothetical protein